MYHFDLNLLIVIETKDLYNRERKREREREIETELGFGSRAAP